MQVSAATFPKRKAGDDSPCMEAEYKTVPGDRLMHSPARNIFLPSLEAFSRLSLVAFTLTRLLGDFSKDKRPVPCRAREIDCGDSM